MAAIILYMLGPATHRSPPHAAAQMQDDCAADNDARRFEARFRHLPRLFD